MTKFRATIFCLIAVTALVTAQAMPRLVALCARTCEIEKPVAKGCGPCPMAEESRAASPCCASERSESTTARVPEPPCGNGTRHCQKQSVPCNACAPTKALVIAPRESALKRPQPTTEPVHPVRAHDVQLEHHLFSHSHSPPSLIQGHSGVERCISIRVLLI